MNQLSPDNTVEFEPQGQIRPSRKAVLKIDREYLDASPAEKWRYAQAQTVIDAFFVPPLIGTAD
jgi:hypothetical protein